MWSSEQENEELKVVVDARDSFNLLDDMTSQNFVKKQKGLSMLQFFHTWVFYYLYSADHKFI